MQDRHLGLLIRQAQKGLKFQLTQSQLMIAQPVLPHEPRTARTIRTGSFRQLSLTQSRAGSVLSH